MALGDLYLDIAGAIARGTSLDDRIPGWVQTAAWNIEANSEAGSYSWMRKRGEITLDYLADVPYSADLPNNRVREVFAIRPKYGDLLNGFRYGDALAGVDENAITEYTPGSVTGFFVDAESIFFDGYPDDATGMTFSIQWAEFTDWSTDPEANPAILARAYAPLKYEALQVAAIDLRDPRFKAFEGDRERSLGILAHTENRLREGFKRKQVMRVPRLG